MYFIGTKIDLKTGILYVESPRCKEKLLIKLKSDLFAAVEEIVVHAQRLGNCVYDHYWFILILCGLLTFSKSSFLKDNLTILILENHIWV